jgi:hypothetical protein
MKAPVNPFERITTMAMTQQQLENPVLIERHGKSQKFVVSNECGDVLCTPRTRLGCKRWCVKHHCGPIPSTWRAYHSVK